MDQKDCDYYMLANIYLRGGDDIKKHRDIENEYLKRYSEIVEIVNERLQEWNDIWREDFYDGNMKEGDSWWNLYGQYLVMHERVLCVSNNKNYITSRITMDCYNNRGEPKIIGIVDQDPNKYFEVEFSNKLIHL